MADVASSRPSNVPKGSHDAPHNESSRDLEEVASEPESFMLPRSIDNDQMEVQTNDPTNQSEVDDPVEGEGIGEDAKDAASEVPQVCISHHQLKVITNHSIGG
jgi:hypothetical protein